MLSLFLAAALFAAADPLPSLREQADVQQSWVQARLERVLPPLMRKHGIAMWLVICREYNEDPVYFSLIGPTNFAARRRTIFVFFDRGPERGVERLALGGGSHGGLYTVYRDPANPQREIYGDVQWEVLRQIIDERKPKTIGVNISHTHAFSDGLSAGEWEQLQAALGAEHLKRVVRAENLPLELISLRLPEMMPYYRRMMETVHTLLRRAFSNEVITPGKTTDQDVIWWLREETRKLGFGTWFHPSVRVQQAANVAEGQPVIIERGDVLWCDFGLTAMRLNTDTQHMGYVMKPGETAPPAGIVAAFQQGHRMQDILMEEMRPGRSGNEVLAAALQKVKAAGIAGSIYSHPVGDHGHGAGPLIGLWDRQQGVPGRGDTVLLPNTWFSIELSAQVPVPEWGGKALFVGLEEDAQLDENGVMRWIYRRQPELYLVR